MTMRLLPFAAVLLLCSVAPTQAIVKYWRASSGRNLNFDNPNIFLNGNTPTNQSNSGVSLRGAERAVTLQVPAKDFYMGSVLGFMDDGVLRINSNGALIFGSGGTGGTAELTAGKLAYNPDEDFNNNDNWEEGPSGSRTVSDLPPCDGDRAIFPEGYSYSVRVKDAESRVNVDEIEFRGASFISSTGCATWPSQELQIDCPSVHIGDRENCQSAVPPLINIATSKCFCFTSTPTDQQLVEQQQVINDANAEYYGDQLDAGAALVSRAFSGTLTAGSLSLTAAQVKTAMWNATDQTDMVVRAALVAALRSKIATVYGVGINNVTVTQVMLMSGGSVVAVAGSVEAQLFKFQDSQGNDNYNGTIALTAAPTTSTSELAAAAHAAVAQELYAAIQRKAAQEGEDAVAGCGAACTSSDAVTVLNSIGDLFENATAAFEILASNSDANATTLATLLGGLALKDGVNAGNVSAFAGAYEAAVETLTPAEVDALNTALETKAEAAVEAQELEDLEETGLPRDEIFPLTLTVAKNEAINNLRLMTIEVNLNTLADTFEEKLVGFGGIKSLNRDSFTAAVVSLTGRRRNSGFGLAVTFNYTKSCLPTETNADCAIEEGDSDFTAVSGRSDVVYSTIVRVCQDTCCSLTTGIDSSCACTTHFQPAYVASRGDGDSETDATTAGRTAYLAVFPCGLAMPQSDGVTCDNPADATASGTTADSCAAAAETSFQASSGGSGGNGGSGNIIVVVAAAAGGLILIVIIVSIVLVRRRKKSVGPTETNNDRTVVAFENPMYDDSSHNASSNTGASGAFMPYSAPVEGGDGLYDTPAFSPLVGSVKANPIYDSQEDIGPDSDVYPIDAGEFADLNGFDGLGYLDVHPDGFEQDNDENYM